jgi:hypothetical protein
MPVLTGSTPAVNDLAAELVGDLNAGRVARASYGDRDAAFAWAAGLPNILARQVNSATVAGLSFDAVRIKPSGTPAGKVAEGGNKPDAVTIEAETIALTKYAGLANFSTERAISTESLAPALGSVLVSSILLAYDADCGAVLDADNGLTAGGADWSSAINAGIAAVAGAGGAPAVLVLSAADYGDAVASPGVGYAMNPTDGVPSMWGLRIVLMAGIASGTGYVIDPAAVLAVENESSPAAIIDPYSGLSTNAVRLAVEAFLGFVVVNPGGVCQLTVTAAARSGGGGAGRNATRDDFALGA